ncbi:MAG: DinB family protein [Acidobacteriota bacterium]|nr:MAG: DinB family protein [Acidobacteriota bacterium]
MLKTTLFNQFNRSYASNGWFVAVRNAVIGVTVEQALWKPDDVDLNCIWEILSHITYYNNAYLQRFKGIDYKYDAGSNNETFSFGDVDPAQWLEDVERFDAVMTEWRELIETADEGKFTENVSSDIQISWADTIATINAHNAYHAGQIVLLLRLQNVWDLEKGVK